MMATLKSRSVPSLLSNARKTMKIRQSLLVTVGIAIITTVVFVIVVTNDPVQSPKLSITERQLPNIENTQKTNNVAAGFGESLKSANPKEPESFRKPSPEIAAMQKTIDAANSNATIADQHIAELKQHLGVSATADNSQAQPNISLKTSEYAGPKMQQTQLAELKQRLQRLQSQP